MTDFLLRPEIHCKYKDECPSCPGTRACQSGIFATTAWFDQKYGHSGPGFAKWRESKGLSMPVYEDIWVNPGGKVFRRWFRKTDCEEWYRKHASEIEIERLEFRRSVLISHLRTTNAKIKEMKLRHEKEQGQP